MASEKQRTDSEIFPLQEQQQQQQPQQPESQPSPTRPTTTTMTTISLTSTTTTTTTPIKAATAVAETADLEKAPTPKPTPITITITPSFPSSSSSLYSHETLSLSPDSSESATAAASLVVAAAQLAAGLLLLGYGLAARSEDVCFAGWMCGLLTTGLLAALLLRERQRERGLDGDSSGSSRRWRPLVVALLGEAVLGVDAVVSRRWWRWSWTGASAVGGMGMGVGGVRGGGMGGMGGGDPFVYYRLGLAALVVFWGGFALEMTTDAYEAVARRVPSWRSSSARR